MSEWISVKDRLPERKNYWERYIVVVLSSFSSWHEESYDKEIVTTADYDSEQKIWHIDWGDSKKQLNALIDIEDIQPEADFVTHWMPLPKPPKESDTNA